MTRPGHPYNDRRRNHHHDDPEREREYVRDYLESNRAADTPLALRIERIIEESPRPLSPTDIFWLLAGENRPSTMGSIRMLLNHLRRAGRIRSLGRGQWIKSEEADHAVL